MNHSLIGQHPCMTRLRDTLARYASLSLPILLLGESGCGKEIAARDYLHAQSIRQDAPWLAINCASLSPELLESTLFGHKKGAFTDAKESRVGRFTLAAGGSLFLDEIACLPLAQQTKLLRVLETGEYEVLRSSQTQQSNVRLISATNADFSALIQQGLFRQDLYYRLNTLEFRIPPLRERPEDILPLADHFLYQHGLRYHKTGLRLSATAQQQLMLYPWPGNLRELSHLLERAVLLCQHSQIEEADLHLPLTLQPKLLTGASQSNDLPALTLEQAELQLIKRALAQHPANKQKAADQLGITKSSLYRRLEKYGLV